MGLQRLDALRDGGLQRRVTSSHYTILSYVAEKTPDDAPPNDPLCRTIAEFERDTPLSRRTIMRTLKELEAAGMIRVESDPRRYGAVYDITIIDPAYVEALAALQPSQQTLPLVRGQDAHSQNGAPPPVSGQNAHSQNGASGQASTYGHGAHSQSDAPPLVRGQNAHLAPGRKVGSKISEYIDQLRSKKHLPTCEAIPQSGRRLNREMISSLIPRKDTGFLDAASEVLQPSVTLQVCAEFTVDLDQGKVSAGALLCRLAHEDLDPQRPAPLSNRAAESDFCHKFSHRVSDYEQEAAQNEQDGEFDFRGDDNGQDHDGAQTDTAPEQADPTWQKTLSELSLQLPPVTFETWVRDTSIISRTDDAVTIGAPSTFARNYLHDRLRKKIERVLKNLLGHPVQVSFAVRGEPQTPPALTDAGETPTPDTEAQVEPRTAPSHPPDNTETQAQAATRERKKRLLELLESKTGSTQQYNAIIKRIKAQVDKVPDVDAFLDSCIERVDEIIAAATPQPATESHGQDAEAGTREGRFNQMRRRRRGHRERESVDTWTTAPAPPHPQPQAQTAGEMEKPAAEPEPQENAQTGGDEEPDRLWQVKEAKLAYKKAQVDTIHQRRQRRQARSSPNPWQERRKPQGGSLPMT